MISILFYDTKKHEHMERFRRKKLSARSSLSLNEGGYDYKFIEEPSDSLKCLICLLVVREPQQHGGCGKLFCKSCITKYGRNDCPHCRQPIRTSRRCQYRESIFNDFKSKWIRKATLYASGIWKFAHYIHLRSCFVYIPVSPSCYLCVLVNVRYI